jgi:4-hydroxyproline epimerase
MSEIRRVRVIDSHTAGEPTRVVIDGGPDLGGGTVAERLRVFRERYDSFRSAVTNEPRGSDVWVGALLLEPSDPSCIAGAIYFNNVGYLGMCGHGTIGLAATLAHLGRLKPGESRIETPVGVVSIRTSADGEVSVRNVPSYRYRADVSVPVEGVGTVRGDVAWGGNWFYLVEAHERELSLGAVDELTDFAWRIRRSLAQGGVAGKDGAEIDHIELFAPSDKPGVHSKNFVLCPGKAYDRSPCGTGTSAKLACLYADGKIKEGEVWRQESIVGGIFEGSVAVVDGEILPTIRGRAYVNAEATLLLNSDDPFRWGIREA